MAASDRLEAISTALFKPLGAILDATHNYTVVFAGLSLLMPVALLIGFFLMKRVEPITDFDARQGAVYINR